MASFFEKSCNRKMIFSFIQIAIPAVTARLFFHGALHGRETAAPPMEEKARKRMEKREKVRLGRPEYQ